MYKLRSRKCIQLYSSGQTEGAASVIFMRRVRILNIILYNLTYIYMNYKMYYVVHRMPIV